MAAAGFTAMRNMKVNDSVGVRTEKNNSMYRGTESLVDPYVWVSGCRIMRRSQKLSRNDPTRRELSRGEPPGKSI